MLVPPFPEAPKALQELKNGENFLRFKMVKLFHRNFPILFGYRCIGEIVSHKYHLESFIPSMQNGGPNSILKLFFNLQYLLLRFEIKIKFTF